MDSPSVGPRPGQVAVPAELIACACTPAGLRDGVPDACPAGHSTSAACIANFRAFVSATAITRILAEERRLQFLGFATPRVPRLQLSSQIVYVINSSKRHIMLAAISDLHRPSVGTRATAATWLTCLTFTFHRCVCVNLYMLEKMMTTALFCSRAHKCFVTLLASAFQSFS